MFGPTPVKVSCSVCSTRKYISCLFESDARERRIFVLVFDTRVYKFGKCIYIIENIQNAQHELKDKTVL